MSNSLTIHILSLFPQSIQEYLESSIPKKAQDSGLFTYYLHNLSDWSTKNTRRVDARVYGGGAGTIITIEPLYNAITDLQKTYSIFDEIIIMSPKGKKMHQAFLEQKIESLPLNILIICGHYEGIDARIFDVFPITELSIGEYVLSSGELAGLVFIDGLVRLVPGVLSSQSLEEETFSKNIQRQGEYPHYSRPEEFRGLSVPKVLLSGDHKKIKKWREEHIDPLTK